MQVRWPCPKEISMTVSVLILAAGRGERIGGDLPKQYQIVAGKPVVAHAIAMFRLHPEVSEIVLVTHPEYARHGANAGADSVVLGGDTRSQSVREGLTAVSDQASHILVHDGARPCISAQLISRVIAKTIETGAAAPAIPVAETLWRSAEGKVEGVVDRKGVWRAQTPQGFEVETLRAAHAGAKEATDDVTLVAALGVDVAIVEGDEDNLKITHPEDFGRAENVLRGPMEIRNGIGFDVHRFGPDGDHVMLCGVKISHNRSLLGHSDADVGLHAITDALFGAIGDGDIGQHFPPSDPAFKDADSAIFLRRALEKVHERGLKVSNIDCTLICEVPKIGPHVSDIKARLSELCQINPDRIGIKATTTERLGFTGRGEGIAAQAAATLVSE